MKNIKKLFVGIACGTIAVTALGIAACNNNTNPNPGPVTPGPDPQGGGERTVKTYIDESFDSLEIGENVEKLGVFEYYEGGGFVASSKDADGNVWIQAKDVNNGSQWALAYTNVYENNVRKYLKDFCLQFDTRLPDWDYIAAADGGACILWNGQAGRYDLALHFDEVTYGAANNSINLWHAMNTDGGPFATTQHDPTWGERGSLVEALPMTPDVEYTITICGKYQGINEWGDEFFTLYVFVDDNLVIYQRDIVYWDGGFGFRGFISPWEYANFKVSDFPKECPDGIDHYTVDKEDTVYNVADYEKIGKPTLTDDSAQKKVTWTAVEGAKAYVVKFGDKIVEYTDSTSFDYSEIYDEGTLSVQALPAASDKLAGDFATVEISNPPTQLDAPVISVSGLNVTWEAVANATSYAVYLNDVLQCEQPGTTYRHNPEQAGTFTVKVKALSDSEAFAESAFSNEESLTVEAGLTISELKIEDGKAVWEGDPRASGYEVIVNGNEAVTVEATEYQLTGSDVGYAVSVRAVDSTGANRASGWLTAYSGETTKLATPVIKYKDGVISWSEIASATGYAVYKDGVLLTTVEEESYTYTAKGVYEIAAIGNKALILDSDRSKGFIAMDKPQAPAIFPNNIATQEVGEMADIGWNNASGNGQYVIKEQADNGVTWIGRSDETDITAFKETWFNAKPSANENFDNWTWTTWVKFQENSSDGFAQLMFGTAATGGRYSMLIGMQNGGAIQLYRNGMFANSWQADMGATMQLGTGKTVDLQKTDAAKYTINHVTLPGDKGYVTVFINDVLVLASELPNKAVGDFGLWMDANTNVYFGSPTVTTIDNAPDGTYTGAPITLSAPEVTLEGSELSWDAIEYAQGYEIYLDGSLYATLGSGELTFDVTEAGVYTVKAIGYKETISASDFSSGQTYAAE